MRSRGIQLKSVEQMRKMRVAGLVVADALAAAREALAPGVTTADLDRIANEVIVGAGAVPSFLGYQGYPATLCVSVNEEIVHGIPGGRVLRAGDLVSVDGGAIVDGWHGDSAFSAIVPEQAGGPSTSVARPEDLKLIEATEQAMWRGIAAIVAGARLNAIGAAVEDFVGNDFGLVEEYGGHGIGTEMHQDPHVLNYRTKDKGPKLRPGMCLAIEPMLTLGDPGTKTLSDDWTVVTTDSSRAAHWEHSVALHDGGIWVLTARDGGREPLAALGVEIAPLN